MLYAQKDQKLNVNYYQYTLLIILFSFLKIMIEKPIYLRNLRDPYNLMTNSRQQRIMKRTQFSTQKLASKSSHRSNIKIKTSPVYHQKSESISHPKIQKKQSPITGNPKILTKTTTPIYHSEYYDQSQIMIQPSLLNKKLKSQQGDITNNNIKKARHRNSKKMASMKTQRRNQDQKRINKIRINNGDQQCDQQQYINEYEVLHKQHRKQQKTLQKLQTNSILTTTKQKPTINNFHKTSKSKFSNINQYQFIPQNSNNNRSKKSSFHRLHASHSQKQNLSNLFPTTKSKHKINSNLSNLKKYSQISSPSSNHKRKSLSKHKSINLSKLNSNAANQTQINNNLYHSKVNNNKNQYKKYSINIISDNNNNKKLSHLSGRISHAMKNTNKLSLLLQSKFKGTRNTPKGIFIKQQNNINYGRPLLQQQQKQSQITNLTDLIQKIQTHIFIINLIGQYCQILNKYHEQNMVTPTLAHIGATNNQTKAIDIIMVQLYQKMIKQLKKIIKTLTNQTTSEYPFILTSLKIPSKILTKYLNNQQIAQIITQTNNQIQQINKKCEIILGRLDNDCPSFLTNPLQNTNILQKQIIDQLEGQLILLGQCLESSRISEDGYVVIQDLIIYTIQIMYIISELASYKIRKVIFPDQVMNFERYYQQNIPIVENVIQYFRSLQQQ